MAKNRLKLGGDIAVLKKLRNPTKLQVQAENVQLRQQVELLTKQVLHMQTKLVKTCSC